MRKQLTNIVKGVLILMLIALMAGCGGGTSTSGEGEAEGNTGVNITLVGADMTPGSSSTAQVFEWWGSEIEKRTNGQVKFNYFWSGSLIGGFEQLEAVKTGNVDFTPYYSGYHPDLAPLPSISLMPMMNIGPLEQSLRASDELFRTHPALAEEFKKNNVKYLYPVFVPDAYVWSTNKPINTIEDFKGLNFRAFGPWLAFFSELGASPVSLPVPEIYDALDRGALDADIMFLPNAAGNSYWEVTKYVNVTNLGANLGAPAVMNLDKWNSLPADIQEIIEQVSIEAIERSVELNEELYARDFQSIKDHGMTITEFSAEDISTMQQIAEEKVWGPFTEELENKGIPAKDVLNTYLELLDKYKK